MWWTSFVTAVIGGLVVLLADRGRWRREDRLRWVANRHSAYAAFLAAIDRWDELDHVAALRGEREDWHEAPPEDLLDPVLGVQTSSRVRPRATAAAMEVAARLVDVELVAPSSVRQAADELRSRARELSWTRFEDPPRSCGGAGAALVAAEASFQTSRDQFVAATRADLRVDLQ